MPAKNVVFQHLCLFQSELKIPVQLLGREEGKRILVGKKKGEIKCISVWCLLKGKYNQNVGGVTWN